MKNLYASLLLALLSFPCSHLLAERWHDVGTVKSIGNTLHVDKFGNLYAACDLNDRNRVGVAKWDGVNWIELGVGGNELNAIGEILIIKSDAAGNIYAAGSIINDEGRPYVAKWDGTTWQELGHASNPRTSGMYIEAIAFDNQGNVFTAGYSNYNYAADFVLKWDGSTWTKTDTTNAGLHQNETILLLENDDAGNVYMAGNSYSNYLTKWTGTGWMKIDTTKKLNGMRDIAFDGLGNLYVVGSFINATSNFYVAKWNGSSWNEVGTGVHSLKANGVINKVRVAPNGNIYAAGNFTDSSKYFTAMWDGTNWMKVRGTETDSQRPNGLTSYMGLDATGVLYTAGNFRDQGKTCVAKWDNTQWQLLSEPTTQIPKNRNIYGFAVDDREHLYVQVPYKAYNTPPYYIAEWDGNSWNQLGDSLSFAVNKDVRMIVTDAAHNVYAAGDFTDATVRHFHQVMKWDGTTWGVLGSDSAKRLNANGNIYSLVQDKHGNLYAAGVFRYGTHRASVAKWDGTQWSELGGDTSKIVNLNSDNSIWTIAVDTFDNVYASGALQDSNNLYYVAKWDGHYWGELGTGFNALNDTVDIASMATDLTGHVYVSNFNGRTRAAPPIVQKWDGHQWNTLGQGSNPVGSVGDIYALVTDAHNNVYISGALHDSLYNYYVSRYNGTAWEHLCSDEDELKANSNISWLAISNAGMLYAAGNFTDFANYNLFSYYNTGIRRTDAIENVVATQSNFSIYPNPNSGAFNIKYEPQENETGQLQIINAVGQTVHTQSLNQGIHTVQLNLPTGLYFATITTPHGSQSLKLSVVK